MLLGNPDFSVTPTGKPMTPEDYFVSVEKGKILLREEGETLSVPKAAELSLPRDFTPFELGRLSDIGIYAFAPGSGLSLPEDESHHYRDYGVFREQCFETASLLMAVRHLMSWYSGHRFCGRCGGKMIPDDKMRALNCPSCGNQVFPVICPAVITAVTCGDQILVAKNLAAAHRLPGLIAGYVEVGETLEHAVAREVMEEVGLEVKNIRYVGNQPWGLSGSHMLAFQAEADASLPIRLQKEELAMAQWIRRSDLEPRENRTSVAAELIERFRTGNL